MGPIKFNKPDGTAVAVSAANPLPVSGGGGSGGGGGLTDDQLRATPVPVVPTLTSGMFKKQVITASATEAGAVALPALACHQATLANVSNEIVWVGNSTGDFFPVFPRAYFTFFGIQDLSAFKVWCTEDTTIYFRVES